MEALGRYPLSDPTTSWAGGQHWLWPSLGTLVAVLPFSLHAYGSAPVYEGQWAKCVPAEPGK